MGAVLQKEVERLAKVFSERGRDGERDRRRECIGEWSWVSVMNEVWLHNLWPA